MKSFNMSDFASLYFEGVTPLNLSLDLDYETIQRLNATAHAILDRGDLMQYFQNMTSAPIRDPLYIVIPITIIYGLILLAGIIGNVSTCIVIVQNRCMHTATNYYLFSLAISDLILLLSGLPPEVHRMWYPDVYVFGEVSCVFLGLASETSANATVLTITAFTVERYIAICHPFLSHTMSKLSRVVKFVIAIWVLALGLAIPQAIQFGVVYTMEHERFTSSCTVKWQMVEHAFEISGFVFFVGPMTVITVLYLLIGIKLRTSRLLQPATKGSFNSNVDHNGSARSYKSSVSQTRAIKMLVAVAVSFFLCWAPFHSQRLLAVYGKNAEVTSQTFTEIYDILTYISGVLYFLSTTINPFLYNIMSNKFRDAFKTTIAHRCCGRHRHVRRSTRCANHARPPAHRLIQRTRIPSTNTHLSTVTCLTRNHLNEGNNNSTKNPMLNRSVSAMIIRTDIAKKSKKDNQNLDDTKNYSKSFTLFTGKFKKNAVAIFNVKEDTVCLSNDTAEPKFQRQDTVTMNVDLNGRDSSESVKSSISNSSLQDMDEEEYTGRELATFMEQVNHNIV